VSIIYGKLDCATTPVLPTPSSYRRRDCFPRKWLVEGEEFPISSPLPFLRIKDLGSAFPRMFLEGRKGEESLYHSHSPFSVSRTLGSAFPSMFLEGRVNPLDSQGTCTFHLR